MDNPAAPSDLTARGYDGAASQDVQGTWLDAAWRALRREVPALESRLVSGELDPADVVDVVAAAAMRVLRNPEGFESESGAIDDYTESWRRADASRDLYFTTVELRRLASAGAFTEWSGSAKYA